MCFCNIIDRSTEKRKMYTNFMPSIFDVPGYFAIGAGFLVLFAWSLVWKGLALWHAAGNKQKNWFILLLLVNTAGILELVYLLFVAPNKPFARKTTQR